MLEPAGDLGLQQEPGAAVGVVGALGLDLFEGDLALQLGVERDRDHPDASASVQVQDLEAVAHRAGSTQAPFVIGVRLLVIVVIGRESRRGLVGARVSVEDGLLTFGPGRIGDRDRGHRRVVAPLSREPPVQVASQAAKGAQAVQASAQVALMLRQKIIHQHVQHRAAVSRERGAGHQNLGKRRSDLATGHHRFASLNHSTARNETQVKSQGFEQQITVRVRARHGVSPLSHCREEPAREMVSQAPMLIADLAGRP